MLFKLPIYKTSMDRYYYSLQLDNIKNPIWNMLIWFHQLNDPTNQLI